jgi:N-carbamoylputrescine amidase
MRVTVCQLSDEREAFAADWDALCAHARRERSELVLLPEMPFSAWFAVERRFEPEIWRAAIAEHVLWKERLGDLAPAVVLATRPVERDGRRLNEAFVWASGAATAVHDKRYLPDEDGFWEASWYDRGDGVFQPAAAGPARVGFQICTELWTLEESRQYGLKGVDVLAAPRATPASSRERWLVAGRAAAILAGAYCISSNRSGASRAGFEFAGMGWIIDPEGEVLAMTSNESPIISLDIDLAQASRAKATYPRYVC